MNEMNFTTFPSEKKIPRVFSAAVLVLILLLMPSCADREISTATVTVPVSLDHNRMLVDGEILGEDGEWHAAKLWIDSGNPEFFLSEALARNLGIDLTSEIERKAFEDIKS